MATVALESPAPSLPFEIWAQILEFYEQSNDTDGLKYIWVNCRQVSSQFRAVVDEMFINKHLPTTWFELHQGRISKKLALNQDPVEDEVNNELGARFLPSSVPFLERIGVEYHFSRMSDDRRLAIFRATSSDQRLIRPRLADLVNQTRPSRLNNSRHLVYVGKEVNDIFIPLRWITADKPEFAVDWEELYSVFFAEEKLYSTLATRNVSQRSIAKLSPADTT